ncbi:MAG: chromate transporter [Burkholderiaceae bacterium]
MRFDERSGCGPSSPRELFWACNALALQGFGGVLAVAQRELVERKRWLTREQFVELLAISQILPGPNIVNLGLALGYRYFGLRGAFAASAGLLALPLLIVLSLAALYSSFAREPALGAALRGMGAVAAGLVLSTASKLSGTLKKNPLGLPLCLGLAGLAFVAIALLRWPLVAVVGALGGAAVLLAWIKLAR